MRRNMSAQSLAGRGIEEGDAAPRDTPCEEEEEAWLRFYITHLGKVVVGEVDIHSINTFKLGEGLDHVISGL